MVLISFGTAETLLYQSTYAQLCGIKRESVYKRIKAGTLSISEYCEHPLIDTEEFPPGRMKSKPSKPPVKRELPDWCYE
jgi:predicted DNA-binding transcriptional regulator AlpA